jgi:ATP-dependent RNA helicase MSS116
MNFLAPKDRSKPNRQTLLFSATYSAEMKEIAKKAMAPGYIIVDTVGEEKEQTHEHVEQKLTVVPLDQQPFELLSILDRQIRSGEKYKVIVFFPTAKQTGSMATLFKAYGVPVYEIHSRLSQVSSL